MSDEQLWKDEAVRKLNEAKAEIYHLTTERDEWHLRTEQAETEVTRLRKAFKEYVRVTTPLLGDSKALAAAIAALKPDTGE
jgi:hypothetical protein